jgi:hypothetical protein
MSVVAPDAYSVAPVRLERASTAARKSLVPGEKREPAASLRSLACGVDSVSTCLAMVLEVGLASALRFPGVVGGVATGCLSETDVLLFAFKGSPSFIVTGSAGLVPDVKGCCCCCCCCWSGDLPVGVATRPVATAGEGPALTSIRQHACHKVLA